jgi:hypothetical protein
MKCNENLSGGVHSYPCIWTDMMKMMVTFRNCVVNTTYQGVNMGLKVNQVEIKMLTQSRTRQRGIKHTTLAWSKFIVAEELKYLGQY